MFASNKIPFHIDIIGNMMPTVKIFAENVRKLVKSSEGVSRMDLAKRIGIGDKTLGIAKEGTGNPTLDTIEAIARFYHVEPWQLLVPDGVSIVDIEKFSRERTSTLSVDARRFIEEFIAAEEEGNSSPQLIAALEGVLHVAVPTSTEPDHPRLRAELDKRRV